MLKLDRPPEAPAVLRSKDAIGSRRQLLEFWTLERQRRAQTSVPEIGINPFDRELVDALLDMTSGKCAFCEAANQREMRAHRFRPPGNALPVISKDPHLYYVWLADAWQNLFPICQGCVPIEPQFPVKDGRARLPTPAQVAAYVERNDGLWTSFTVTESALLLDPTVDRTFDRYLVPKRNGELAGRNERGSQTIAVFNLNRSELQDERANCYARRIDRLLSGVGKNPSDEAWDGLFDFKQMEFGGSWYLLLRRLARFVIGTDGGASSLGAAQIQRTLERLAQRDDAPERFEVALQQIENDDASTPSNVLSAKARTLRASVAAVDITNFKAIERLDIRLDQGAAAGRDPSGASAAAKRVPALIILGENATGKSSILEAIALTLASPNAVRALNPSWPRLVLDSSQLGMDTKKRGLDAKIQVRLTSGQSATLAIVDGVMTPRSDFGSERLAVFAYGAFRRYLNGTLRASPHRHIRNLFDGSNLSNPEPWLKKLKKDRFDMVVRTLRDLLSVEGEFDVIQRDPSTRQLRMVTSVTEPNGTVRLNRTPLSVVSSGYRSMLAMVCDILQGLLDENVYQGFEDFQTAQGLILIDEIEAHLHPRWKVQVMASLRAALPRMTFITTTHDPLCLRGMDDDEVLVLQRVPSADGTAVSAFPIVVEPMRNLPKPSDLRVDQLLTSDFFQLFSTDDAASDRKLAHVADLIAKRDAKEPLTEQEVAVLTRFQTDIATALPVGSSEVHRIVQEAVAEFLSRRREATSETLARLRDETKTDILRALEQF